MKLTMYFKEPKNGMVAMEITCNAFSFVDYVVCAAVGNNTNKYYYNVSYVVARS